MKIAAGIGSQIKSEEGFSYFSIESKEHLWVVENGSVDIYVTIEKEGKREAKPIFLLHRDAGHIIFPFAEFVENISVKVYLLEDALLRQIPLNQIGDSLNNDADFTSDFLKDISSWVIAINERIVDLPNEEIDTFLYVNKKESFNPTQSLDIAPYFEPIYKDRLMWIETENAPLNFLSKDFLTIEKGIVFPLSYITWVQVQENCDISTYDTQTVLCTKNWKAGLDKFHELIIQYTLRFYQHAAKEEETRIEKRKKTELNILNATFQRLLSLFEKRSFTFVDRRLSMLGQCCQIIGKYSGIVFSIPKQLKGENIDSQLSQICEESSIRYRKVRLVGKWWKQDNGHLLVFDLSGAPFAVIRRRYRYEVIEPKTMQVKKIDKKIVQGLQNEAYMFYPSMEEEQVSGKKLWNLFVKNHGKDIFTLILVGLGSIFLALFVPFANAIIFNYVIPLLEKPLLVQLVLGLFVFSISASIFSFISSFTVLRLQTLINNRLQTGLWDKLLNLPIAFFYRFTIGDLVRRVFSIWQIRNILTSSFFATLFTGIFSFLYLVMMFYYSWSLSFIGLIVIFIGIIVNWICISFKVKIDTKMLDEQGLFNGFIIQVISGIEKIRLRGAESIIFSKWGKRYSQIKSYNINSMHIANFLQAFNQMMPILGTFSVFAMGVYLVSHFTTFRLGDFIAFNAAFGSFSVAVYNAFSIAIQTFGMVIPQWNRAKIIFQEKPESIKTQISPGNLHGLIDIDNVYFRYNENLPSVLKGVSIKVRPGEFVAVIGPSGCGKSTLVWLLLRFNEPTSGSIYYDGKDLKELDVKKVRRQMGIVLQDSEILAGSIYENLICGGVFLPEEVDRAMQLTGFDQTLKDFPMGVQTYLTDNGKNLSGGQKQQLLITRALLGQPKILIFDEATNALDSKSQAMISENIEKLKITRLVIAHRLSTIRNADRIYLLNEGRIEESGTFDELLAKSDRFSFWLQRQQK